MIALFIDSSCNKYNLGLFINNKYHYYSFEINRNLTQIAVKSIEDILLKNNCKYNQITDIYVTTGPGSFSGVRIALSIAKTIIVIYSYIKLHYINTLNFQLLNQKSGISVVDARSNCKYVLVKNNDQIIISATLITVNELQEIFKKYNLLKVYQDMVNIDDILFNLNKYFDQFLIADDYKKISAFYIKPAYDFKK